MTTLGPENLRLVLGLKTRALREERGWTLQELARRSGLAISYLSEIEKGKKYPKPEKLLALAGALELPFEELVSPRVEEELSPLSAFAASEFLREFPFELFGLELEVGSARTWVLAVVAFFVGLGLLLAALRPVRRAWAQVHAAVQTAEGQA